MYCYYYDYQFEEQRHESVLFPEIYVASPSVVEFPTPVFHCLLRRHEFPRDVFAINF
jgi:hypothetical protein